VAVVVHGGSETTFGYDRLVIATGARCKRPVSVPSAQSPGVFCLRTMEDGFAIEAHIRDKKPVSVLIVGGGYVGVEMADALARRGMSVTLCGRGVLGTIDPSLGEIVIEELGRHDVHVINASVTGVTGQSDDLGVSLSDGGIEKAEMVLFAAGVEPSTELSRGAGANFGESGAIAVSRGMETSVAGIYAAGDCAETWHRLLERSVYLPLGTSSHKQGRIAGENAAGGAAEYQGTLGTQVVKVFDLAVARTGLSDREASDEGYAPLTVEVSCPDCAGYYPGSHQMRFRLTADSRTGQLLGAQIVGDWRAQVAKRVDVLATAIHHRMRVQDLEHLDLSYTPPLGTPWDPVQVAAHSWMKA
jgi:NADPH-dependent 2,4-dienoyl-CoA reductase/sulfur reductase-like enzyme